MIFIQLNSGIDEEAKEMYLIDIFYYEVLLWAFILWGYWFRC